MLVCFYSKLLVQWCHHFICTLDVAFGTNLPVSYLQLCRLMLICPLEEGKQASVTSSSSRDTGGTKGVLTVKQNGKSAPSYVREYV